MTDSHLIQNLQVQVERLIQELKDLEECKEELSNEEYQAMKEETVEQIKEFSDRLEKMNKGDLTINSKFSTMRDSIRSAISKSFNTLEMIKMFGEQNANELERQLLSVDQEYKLKKISEKEMEQKKSDILHKLQQQGHPISEADQKFLNQQKQREMQQLQDVSPDD